jgi:branched-chain amino acid transport system substrate-binding protein
VLAAQKLVNQDKIFAMVAHIGTPTNIAAMPVQFEKNVVNFYPVTAAREMYEPFNKLKFAGGSSYYDQMRVTLPRLVKEKGAKKVCTLYQDDDFGLDFLQGVEAGLKSIDMTLAEKTSYKRGATDFSSQVARMKAAGCDVVALGTIIRETIGTIAEGKKTGFNPTLHRQQRGLHRPHPQARRAGHERPVRHAHGAASVPGRRGAADPLLGHQVQDQVQRGPDRVLGVRLQLPRRLHPGGAEGGAEPHDRQLREGGGDAAHPVRHVRCARAGFGPKKHWGSDLSRLSQIQDGKWKVVTDYAQP